MELWSLAVYVLILAVIIFAAGKVDGQERARLEKICLALTLLSGLILLGDAIWLNMGIMVWSGGGSVIFFVGWLFYKTPRHILFMDE